MIWYIALNLQSQEDFIYVLVLQGQEDLIFCADLAWSRWSHALCWTCEVKKNSYMCWSFQVMKILTICAEPSRSRWSHILSWSCAVYRSSQSCSEPPITRWSQVCAKSARIILACCATLYWFIFRKFTLDVNGGAFSLSKLYIPWEKCPATTKCVSNATLSNK